MTKNKKTDNLDTANKGHAFQDTQKKKEIDVSKNNGDAKPKCVDLQSLYQRTKSNPRLMVEMISIYLEQTPTLIQTIKQSLKDQDWNTLYGAAHKMIPSFSIMGIDSEFENIAKKIQENAKMQERTDEIPQLISRIECVCNQACTELKEELNIIKNKQA